MRSRKNQIEGIRGQIWLNFNVGFNTNSVDIAQTEWGIDGIDSKSKLALSDFEGWAILSIENLLFRERSA